MTIDVCLPVYHNLRCLKLALRGLARAFREVGPVPWSGRVLFHIQDPSEEAAALEAYPLLNPQVVSRGGTPENMCDILNRLANSSTADWIVFMEQDTFLDSLLSIPTVAGTLDCKNYFAAGPVDTMHYSHPNARFQQFYGEHGRLSPQPGYFHSSLIFVRRSAIAHTKTPFSIPEGFKMHGTGVLGGETYYGLRVNLPQEKERIAFFDQTHCRYGYGANLTWGELPLATHLYYSGTKDGYRDSGFISNEEHAWMVSEENRFLEDYERGL